jgi:uncharacterized repeat protein (TIGR04076 family)
MTKLKITVLKRMHNPELVNQYLKDKVQKDFGLCDVFKEGQEFILNEPFSMPADFCRWAWNDIQQSLTGLTSGDYTDTVYKDQNIVIAGCTDGLRPVIFKIEKFAE